MEEKQIEQKERNKKSVTLLVLDNRANPLFNKTILLSRGYLLLGVFILLLFMLLLSLILFTPFLRKTNLVGKHGLVTNHAFVANVLGDSTEEYEEALWNYYTNYDKDPFVSREQLIQNMLLLDSLENELNLWRAYGQNIQAILEGEKPSIHVDSLRMAALKESDKQQVDRTLQDTILRSKVADLTARREAAQYQKKYYSMHTPMAGNLGTPFDSQQEQRGIVIESTSMQPVMAVNNGTLTLVTWNAEDGGVVQLQHENNMVSTYKKLSKVIKKEGDRLSTGEVIGYVGVDGSTAGTAPKNQLYFELWHNGNAVNPENYILF